MKVQVLMLSLFGIIILKLSYTGTYKLVAVVNEILLFIAIAFLIINAIPYVRRQGVQPISILIGLIFASLANLFIFQGAQAVLGLFGQRLPISAAMVELLISTMIHIILIGSATYMFCGLRAYFFLKQKQKRDVQFNALAAFFSLSALTAFLEPVQSAKFIHITFFTVSILIIIYNSTSISWIAVLSKREKRKVLLLSIALIIISIINLSLYAGDSVSQMMKAYSAGFANFFLLVTLYVLIYTLFLFFTSLFHLPTAEAIDRRSQKLESLQYVSKLLNQIFDPQELAGTVTELAATVCGGDAAWIVLESGDNKTIFAPTNITSEKAQHIFEAILPTLSDTSEEILFCNLKSVMKNEAQADTFCYVAVVPLRRHQAMSGYLIAAKKTETPFDEDDRNTLETFAYYVAIALENSRLFSESLERERLARELDVARAMQRKLIPYQSPKLPNLSISASFIPAYEVGGDYYDFFTMKNGNTGFIIADVAGKGISAAFIMAEMKGIFESLSVLLDSPKEILSRANQLVKQSLDKRQFITAIFGAINPITGVVTLARAGHPPALLLSEHTVTDILPRGIGLGLNYDSRFDLLLVEHSFTLRQNDALILFTDGITEAMNAEKEDFGIARLRQHLESAGVSSPEQIEMNIIESVTKYAATKVQHDDITLIVMQWKNKNMEK